MKMPLLPNIALTTAQQFELAKAQREIQTLERKDLEKVALDIYRLWFVSQNIVKQFMLNQAF